ncbi:TetR/AcrR family transcriptional regulator [Erythrobacter aurantius]|uniref:TetR/AcrR family transcriptional regulator n=1 Tax=Erythrobacter aurantius TaxID=2909249 RepID=UPI00207AC0C8|nr:TetR/AcrR family transcriptional regulator [Erythrobacter aurantius]
MASQSKAVDDVTRRKSPKQQRALATAEAIVQATQQIIVKDGYKAATTNRIAETAGVSVGSLYQYFPNKQAIVRTLIEETVTNAAVRVRGMLRDLMDVPLEPALRQIMTVLVEVYKENDFVLFRILDEVPELKDYTQNLAIEIHTHSTNLAFLEQHQHELKVQDLKTSLLLIERATIHSIECYLDKNPTNITEQQFIDELTRMALNYLSK